MRRFILFIVAFALWLLLTLPFDWQHFWAGLAVAFLVSIIFGNMFVKDVRKCFQIKRYLWFMVYLPLFLWECFKANLDVAYRVLHPAMPINPGIVKVRTNLKTDIGKTFLANSITMTPGTLCVDIQGEYLYIHWINVRAKEIDKATKFIVAPFERLLARIFE